MGAIADRTDERLTSSDIALVKARRRLIRLAVDLKENGRVPYAVFNGKVYNRQPADIIVGDDVTWEAIVDADVSGAEIPGSTLDAFLAS